MPVACRRTPGAGPAFRPRARKIHSRAAAPIRARPAGFKIMARVRFGGTVIGMRGHVGGLVFSRNVGVDYVKPKRQCPYKQTPTQTFQRGVMSYAAGGWWALNDGQRLAWNNFAKAPSEYDYDPWGRRRYLSGFQWYTRCATRRLSVFAYPLADPPSAPPPTAVTGFTLHLHQQPGAACYAQWTAASFGATDSAIVSMAIATRPGQQVKTSNFYQVLSLTNPGNTQEDITSAVLAAFGNIMWTWIAFGRCWKQEEYGSRSVVATVRIGVGL